MSIKIGFIGCGGNANGHMNNITNNVNQWLIHLIRNPQSEIPLRSFSPSELVTQNIVVTEFTRTNQLDCFLSSKDLDSMGRIKL